MAKTSAEIVGELSDAERVVLEHFVTDHVGQKADIIESRVRRAELAALAARGVLGAKGGLTTIGANVCRRVHAARDERMFG